MSIARLSLAALATAAVFAPTAAAGERDICVESGHHHIGEICSSQVVPVALNKAECLTTDPEPLGCVLPFPPNVPSLDEIIDVGG